MLLYIFDTDFEQIGILDNYTSLQWTEDYHGRGSFSLFCADDADNIAMLNMGYYLYQFGKRTAMMIRYIERDSESMQLTVRGFTTLDLLTQRIVFPEININNVEIGMYAIVRDGVNKSADSLAHSRAARDARVIAINNEAARLNSFVNDIQNAMDLLPDTYALPEYGRAMSINRAHLRTDLVAMLAEALPELDITASFEPGVDGVVGLPDLLEIGLPSHRLPIISISPALSQINSYIFNRANDEIAHSQRIYEMEIDSNRNVNNIITADMISGLQGYTQIHDTRIIGDELTEALAVLGGKSELGYYMAFDFKNKRHVFTVYRGLDRTHSQKENPPAVFSAEYGNLKNVLITDDMSIFKNTVYVMGEEDERKGRYFAVAGATKGIDRHETFLDASREKRTFRNDTGETITMTDLEYEALLRARGLEALNERLRGESFSGVVEPVDWGTEYFLGDKITCVSNRYNVRLDTRIMQYTEVTENNKTTLTLLLGEPEVIFI